MALGSVNMTVVKFFVGCFPDIYDFDIKMKCLPGKWMVTIQGDEVFFDTGNSK